MVGTAAQCPSCKQVTELVLETPEIEAAGVSKRTVFWTVLTILILLAGLAGAFYALNQARNLKSQRNKKTYLMDNAPVGQLSTHSFAHFLRPSSIV